MARTLGRGMSRGNETRRENWHVQRKSLKTERMTKFYKVAVASRTQVILGNTNFSEKYSVRSSRATY
jgi:hypothetical protein